MKIIKVVAVLFGAVLFVSLGGILQRAGTGMYASPDETAVSVFSKAGTFSEGFRIPVTVGETARNLVQLHPRSMVRQGDWLVPVGFLGMPFLAMVANKLVDGLGDYLTLILVLSSSYPLFQLLKKKATVFIAWSSVVLYLSFPTILLYVNRGLFPNLPVVALALWGVWLLSRSMDLFQEKKNGVWRVYGGIGGFVCALALFIRPIEALWVFPWMAWALWPIIRLKLTWKSRFLFKLPILLALVIVGCLGLWFSMRTYPFHGSLLKQPISGYQLSDHLPSGATVSVVADEGMRDIRSLVPIAFHPRVIWQNIRLFFFGMQGIWFCVAILGGVVAWLRFPRASVSMLVLSVWTFCSLLLMYGQTAYADNITGSITLGNSFLRYLLPIAPLVAIGCSFALDFLRTHIVRGHIVAIGLLSMLASYGVAYALNGDNESILATRRELVRYREIRLMADVSIRTDSVIISERSDKIFASGAWTVASPIPDRATLTALRDSGLPVYLFHRRIDSDLDAPESISGLFRVAPDPLLILDNEALYQLGDFSSQLE